MNREFDTIVVGVGGIGSAACYWAARAGERVLGLEQFTLLHANGASQDHSRILRLAQFEEPYASLAPSAYRAWHAIEEESGVQVTLKTGGLIIEDVAVRAGLDTGDRNIEGYVRAFQHHGVDFELHTADDVMARWPQYTLRGDEMAIYQKDSGIADAAKGVAVHVALARSRGAVIKENTPVRALRSTPAGVEVVTDDETYLARHVITAADGWTNEILPPEATPLPYIVTQEQVTYYATENLADFAPAKFPVFMWHGADNFYGFPVYGEVATKLGQHLGGHEVTSRSRTFVPDPVRIERQRNFLTERIPGFLGPELYTKTCLYTIPPDNNFVLGPLKSDPRICVFIGAGHAYKFASLMGQILTDVILKGSTAQNITGFETDRQALTDPNFNTQYHR
ncbi:N-methyl-L-tryptophan oxidase [soil metagenome]